MSMLKNVIGLMFGASMSYYMFTLAGGIPLSLNLNKNNNDEHDDYDYIEIEEGC